MGPRSIDIVSGKNGQYRQDRRESEYCIITPSFASWIYFVSADYDIFGNQANLEYDVFRFIHGLECVFSERHLIFLKLDK